MIPVVRLHPKAELPVQMTLGSAGYDLTSVEDAVLEMQAIALVKTGISMRIPSGHVGLICPRSGLAAKHGVTVLNGPGVIDSDYEGEIGVVLANFGKQPFEVRVGMRIAQMVIVPYHTDIAAWAEASSSETARGARGFGSTDL